MAKKKKKGSYSVSDYFEGYKGPKGYNSGQQNYDTGDFFSDIGDSVLGAFGFGESASERAMRRAQEAVTGIQLPEVQNLDLRNYSSAGDVRKFVTPQGQTELNNLNIDPTGRQAQLDALTQLQTLANTQGLAPQDQALLDELERNAAAKERGSREAILAGAERRGLGSSDLTLASQLGASQGAASDRSQRELDALAQARQRSIDAIRSSADLGGIIRTGDTNLETQRGSAQDVINRFNAAQMTAAGADEIAKRQRLRDLNVGNTNQERITNREVPLENYNNIINRQLLIADLANNRAGMKDSRASGSLGASIGKAARAEIQSGLGAGASALGNLLGGSKESAPTTSTSSPQPYRIGEDYTGYFDKYK